EEIISAARYHTTGKKDINLLEKIIYVSDLVEPTRNYPDVEYYRDLAEKNLDRALFEAMRWIIEDKKKKGENIHKDTLEMFDEYTKNGFR
ncbi:MAG: phosphohydrolase, partial [Clostridia bacterium]|nr:phosphohydrolase [Clostridia bacterium]